MFYRPSESSEDIDISFDEGGGACPICKTEDGACVGNTRHSLSARFLPKKQDDFLATFIVPERVYEGTGKAKRLLYPAGAKIRVEEAKRLGIIQ